MPETTIAVAEQPSTITQGAGQPSPDAAAMLASLSDVGVSTIALVYTDLTGGKVDWWPTLPLDWLRSHLPQVLGHAADHQFNVIIRPATPINAALIQLDDLDAAVVDRLRPVAFMVLETSPGNFQAWLALAAAEAHDDFVRRLRAGTGADTNASGSVRLAGSINFKPEYAPDFPTVRLVASAQGRITSREALEGLGVVAAQAPAPSRPNDQPADLATGERRTPWNWPDYKQCLDGAPMRHDGRGPDRSRADFTWCLMAIDWGWSAEATAARLMELSEKARENGPDYARRTSQNAATAAERNRQRRG